MVQYIATMNTEYEYCNIRSAIKLLGAYSVSPSSPLYHPAVST